MKRCLPAVLLVLAAVPALAQAQDDVFQQPKKGFRFAGDALARYEWTRDVPDGTGALSEEKRWRLQARPRVELNVGPFTFGAGGEFNYSQDENDKPEAGQSTLTIVRDNYRSRDARIDLAFGKVKLGPVVAQGGRFVMPIPLTEMIWDRDLRPQGGAAGIELGGQGSTTHFALTGIYAKGSHVFEDESVMYGGAAELTLAAGASSSLQLVGSYLKFDHLDKLTSIIRRQNTRLDGLIVNPYGVVDGVLRISTTGQVPVTLVADYCWNTAIDTNNRGLWLAAILGSLGVTPARLEYTYARVDRDATVAAFGADDFYWVTGWEGHRGDIGTAAGKHASVHAIAQIQRFKDHPNPLVSGQWVKRYRLEYRASF